jgi:replicative DNA helicase
MAGNRANGRHRVPPHDAAAERAVLGGMLLRRDALDAVRATGLAAADFYVPAHGAVYSVVLELEDRGVAVDPVTVAAELDRRGQLDNVGGTAALAQLQNSTPLSWHAPHHARLVLEQAARRRLIAGTGAVLEAAWDGTPTDELVAGLTADAARPVAAGLRLTSGVRWIDAPDDVPAVWGDGDEILWAQGESLIVTGPAGVGKSTVAGQLVAGRLGLTDDLLGLTVAAGAGRVLYLAMDRPQQIGRAMRRLFGPDDRDVLDDRVRVWHGPLFDDVVRHPATLARLCVQAHADTLIIDSLKDLAIGLADDEVGAGVNRAVQIVLAEGIEVAALHHQRKGQGGVRPRTLEDVYGSTWLTAGAGSVVLLWGAAGDPIVELIHLKQPAAEVGPLKIEHDQHEGTSTVYRGCVDALTMLRGSPHGLTAVDLARLMVERTEVNDNERKKAQRKLDDLARRGLAHKRDGVHGGAGGAQPARYFPIVGASEEAS